MKLNKWFIGALACSLFAACSSNEPDSDGTENGGKFSTSSISYLGVSLELPSEPATRGANDVFDDGIPIEYQVDHAAILLFQGTAEASSRFIGAYELGTDQAFDQPNGDQITVSFQKSIKVLEKPILGANEKLWGLAIVNYSENIFKISGDPEESEDYGDLIVKTTNGDIDLTRISEADETNSATTFEQFRAFITTSPFIRTGSNLFFMTNAPLSTTAGATSAYSGTIQTLAELKANFKKTEAEAVQNPAGCIFVERALAKITISGFPTSAKINSTTVTLGAGGVPTYDVKETTLKIKGVQWCLDNEEPTSYIVRNAQQNNPFWSWARFIGTKGMNDNAYDSNPMHQADGTTWYRTYWCIDPAYSTDKTFNNQAVSAAYFTLTEVDGKFLTTIPLYSRENTFDVAHQNYKNTTRVIFKVTYKSEQPIYAVRGQLQTMYPVGDAQNLLKRTVLGSIRLHNLILTYKKENITSLDYEVGDLAFVFGDAPAADTDKNIAKGDYVITSLSFTEKFITDNFKALTDEDKANIATEMAAVAASANQANHIVPFKDNVAYYAVYLKHFGDTYCPLPEGWMGNSVTEVYNGDNSKYLGRYGLVRNNWYDLTIGEINRLGNATIPNGNVSTSDDNKTDDWFLTARVHVLSWAKRTQKTDF